MTPRIPPAGTRGVSVRARVLGYLLVLTAVALAVAGTTAFLIERDSVRHSITDELRTRTDDYLRYINDQGAVAIDVLLRETMGQYVGASTEGAVAVIDGSARYVPATDSRLRLEDDAELLDAIWSDTSTSVEVRRLSTPMADYAYTSIPFLDQDGTRIASFVLAVDEGRRVHELRQTFAVYALVAVLALIAIGTFGFFTVGRLLEPIGLLERTARRITETDLSQRVPIVGDDDLARLSSTVNSMLDRLEGAFADQRRLLDDASHELRTPLTVIRARLELLEPRDPEQVEATRDELIEVADDMSRLVEDLVTLAKADRPEFLRLAQADVGELTDVAATRMASLGERRWEIAARAQGRAVLDAQRLTQAWMQLAANAVKFSEPGTTVRIGSGREGTDLLLWIADEGRGMRPEDVPRIRERFVRLDPDAEGSGLGLPIVAAIVHAHGGELDVESVPGGGSTFSIRVPWREA